MQSDVPFRYGFTVAPSKELLTPRIGLLQSHAIALTFAENAIMLFENDHFLR